MSIILPSVSAFLGVLIGSWLTHFFSTRREQQSHLRQQRSKIYGEFLEAFAASALAICSEDLKKSDRRIANLRTQIALVGGNETLKSLGNLFEFRDFSKGDGELSLMKLIADMRVDVLAGDTQSNASLVKQAVHGN